MWGVAGSAFQIEGGLQLEGRGPSALDALGAIPDSAGLNDSNTADMNYFLYKQDILRLAAIGVPYYSFSISWSRVVPFGLANTPINTQALDHYEDLIKICLENGITPIVTLNHIDNPASVDFDDPNLSEHFLYYAKEVMTRYADRIPYWITFNEANAGIGYSYNTYNAMTHILLAHAAVYDWYKKELGGTGKITMKFANNLAIPLDLTKSEDVAATFRYQNFLLGIMGNPLFLGEQYPADVLATPGLNLTRLTNEQIAVIHGRADVYAFDPYVAQFAASPPTSIAGCASNSSDPLWPRCAVLGNTQANGWLMGQPSSDYAYIAPQYVRQQLGYVWRTFRPSGILIAEFGFNPFAEDQKDLNGQRYDLERSLYHHDFLHEMLKAIHEDGIKVVGAFVWSFLDNNEAGSYKKQYGMQSVNRTDGRLTRHYKRSFFDFVDFFHQHVL
jgi:beta-glucosidase/6-phospho-beta-glucosidase/beta-galactosidase